MHKEAGHQIESAVEARAGFLDRPVLVILCVSTIVAALAMGVVWIGMTFFGGCGLATRPLMPRQHLYFRRRRQAGL